MCDIEDLRRRFAKNKEPVKYTQSSELMTFAVFGEYVLLRFKSREKPGYVDVRVPHDFFRGRDPEEYLSHYINRKCYLGYSTVDRKLFCICLEPTSEEAKQRCAPKSLTNEDLVQRQMDYIPRAYEGQNSKQIVKRQRYTPDELKAMCDEVDRLAKEKKRKYRREQYLRSLGVCIEE